MCVQALVLTSCVTWAGQRAALGISFLSSKEVRTESSCHRLALRVNKAVCARAEDTARHIDYTVRVSDAKSSLPRKVRS